MATTTLEEEDVEIVRVPVDRVVTIVPSIRTEGGVTIVPILEEVVVLQKQLVLREELHIHRHRRAATVEIPVSLRRQRAIVEHTDGNEANANRSHTDDV